MYSKKRLGAITRNHVFLDNSYLSLGYDRGPVYVIILCRNIFYATIHLLFVSDVTEHHLQGAKANTRWFAKINS